MLLLFRANKHREPVSSISAKSLGIADVDISTLEGAQTAIDKIRTAINTVSETPTWQKKWCPTRRTTSSYKLLRQCLHRLTRSRRAYCSYSSSKTVISTLDSYQHSSTTNISAFVRYQASKVQTCDKRNLKAKASETRCFCCLETANTIPREHAHAQQHDPLLPHAHHQHAPVSSIPPSKSSLPGAFAFDGKHEL